MPKDYTRLVEEIGPSQIALVRRIPKQTLIRAGEKDPNISGMSYNSARDELFLADRDTRVVHAMRVRDNAGDLRDVYRASQDMSPFLKSVCHMSVSDTLLVCSGDYFLVALSRNGSVLLPSRSQYCLPPANLLVTISY